MNVFMARQPIFDAQMRVFAYELLFRSDIENVFKGAELTHASSKGEPSPLRAVLDSVLAYERGEWDRCSETAAMLSLDEEVIPQIYLKAIEWTNKIFQTH